MFTYVIRASAAVAILAASASYAMAGKLTCSQGSESVCDAWCGHVGGGMSSNPDGSVSCSYAMASYKAKMDAKKKYDITKLNKGDWKITAVSKKKPKAK